MLKEGLIQATQDVSLLLESQALGVRNNPPLFEVSGVSVTHYCCQLISIIHPYLPTFIDG